MQQSTLIRMLAAAASLRLALAGMVFLAGGVLATSRSGAPWVALPLGLLALNLLASIVHNEKLRRQGPLLGLHLCLLLLLTLAAYGQLTAFRGRLELSEGQLLDPAQVVSVRSGPWHRMGLPDGVLEQGDIAVEYGPGLVRGRTRSRFLIRDGSGGHTEVEVGDDIPLVRDGYRLYTTPNKGFAVRLRWTQADGTAVRGSVHLPAYPLLPLEQRNRWRTPAGTEVALGLELAEAAPETRAWTLRSRGRDTRLRVSAGPTERLLTPGESLDLPQGRLTYEGVTLWMGYRIFYDPTLPWLFATALCAILCLAWHFQRKLWGVPLAVPEPRTTRRDPGGLHPAGQ